MAFCPNCGNGIADGTRFCPSCGATVPAAAPAQPQAQQFAYQAQPAQQQYARPQATNDPWGDTQKANSSFEYRNEQNRFGQNAQQQNAYQQNAYQQQNAYNTQQGNYNQFAGNYNQNASNANGAKKNLFDMPDYTAKFDAQDIEQNKVVAVLSYLGILVIVPIISAKHSPFCKFHANQGLLVTIAFIAYSLLTSIISAVIGGIFYLILKSSVVHTILTVLFAIPGLVFVAAAIAGIVFSATGKAKELPFTGKFKLVDLILEKMK